MTPEGREGPGPLHRGHGLIAAGPPLAVSTPVHSLDPPRSTLLFRSIFFCKPPKAFPRMS